MLRLQVLISSPISQQNKNNFNYLALWSCEFNWRLSELDGWVWDKMMKTLLAPPIVPHHNLSISYPSLSPTHTLYYHLRHIRKIISSIFSGRIFTCNKLTYCNGKRVRELRARLPDANLIYSVHYYLWVKVALLDPQKNWDFFILS